MNFNRAILSVLGVLLVLNLALPLLVNLSGLTLTGVFVSVAFLVVVLYASTKARTKLDARTLDFIALVIFSAVAKRLLNALVIVAARSHAPLVDAQLARLDGFLPIQTPYFMHIAGERFFNWCYGALEVYTFLVIVVLATLGKREAKLFILAGIVAAIACIALFALFPSIGPWSIYGYQPTSGQHKIMTYLLELRGGGPVTIDFERAFLVCFPSYHTALAVLCAIAFWHNRWLRWPGGLFTACICLSTVTTGWHYVTDVLAGAGIAFAAQWVATYLIQPVPAPAYQSTDRDSEALGYGSADIVGHQQCGIVEEP